jgi:hypothetical protein
MGQCQSNGVTQLCEDDPSDVMLEVPVRSDEHEVLPGMPRLLGQEHMLTKDKIRHPKQTEQVVVALDMDDTLCSMVADFAQWCYSGGNPHASKEMIIREIFDADSSLRAGFLESKPFANLREVPGASQALRRLQAAGIRLEVVTSRSEDLRAVTERTLQRRFPGMIQDIHFTNGTPKGLTCQRIGAAVLVDDMPANVVDAVSSGIPAVLFDLDGQYSWSKEPHAYSHVRLQSWNAVADWILQKVSNSAPNMPQKCEGTPNRITAVPQQPPQSMERIKAYPSHHAPHAHGLHR